MWSLLSTSITQALIGQERYVSLKLIASMLQFTTSQWTSWFYHSPDYFYAFLLRESFSSVRPFYSSTLFRLSFRSVVTFVSTAVRHSHSYIRCTCSSSFSAAFVSFTVRHSHCVCLIHHLLMVFVYTKSVFRFYFVRVLYCSS